jgi:CubicO group peptidase (beta-lactamase class C family)
MNAPLCVVLVALCAVVVMAGSVVAAVSGQPEGKAMQEFVTHPIRFAPFCFRGETFPTCDFDDPEAVKALIGPYTISCTFYDGEGKQVTTAEKPGRYAAVVDVKRVGGLTSKRFVTLFRLADAAPAVESSGTEGKEAGRALFEDSSIDRDILAAHESEFAMLMGRVRPGVPAARTATMKEAAEALVAANLQELTALKAAGKPLPTETLSRLERQWWVGFKRHYYGYDAEYPKELVCPTVVEGLAARTLRDGTPAQAGMKRDAVKTIDAACNAWVKDVNMGFSLCVVRRGVVVINKAYGTQGFGPDKDKVFTAETVGPLASTTKFLSAILMLEFVDRGALGLDEPVGTYAPALRELAPRTNGRPLTIRDCYVHIGGFAASGNGDDRNNDLEEMVADLYPTLEVGVRHQYEGTGLALGGKLMEMLSGESIPRLYRNHLFDPLGCADTDADGTAGGSTSTAFDLAKIGQMVLNGGAYGDKRFFHPQAIRAMMPIPGRDRFEPDVNIRWGVGIKQFDIDGLSDEAFGHPGASGSCLVIDPSRDLVVSMIRFDEGSEFPDFLKRKAVMYRAILGTLKE